MPLIIPQRIEKSHKKIKYFLLIIICDYFIIKTNLADFTDLFSIHINTAIPCVLLVILMVGH